ncbi:AAA family ATPase [Pseudomonas syringae]|nr:AAA family ATPase [Pseudomonas syringae]
MAEKNRKTNVRKGPIFLASKKDIRNFKPAESFIIPIQTRLDDYELALNCIIAIRITDDLYESFKGYCAIYRRNSTMEAVQENKWEGEVDTKELKHTFSTMLADAQSYSQLFKLMGPTKTKEILTNLNDVALVRGGKTPPRWPDFFQSEQFIRGFIRSSESYFAFRNAYRIINGLSLDLIDTRQTFSVKLLGNGPKFDFNFMFDKSNIFRGRIAVIIGQNGTGKTASLAKLAKGFADQKSKQALISNKPEFNQVIVFIHTASKAQFRPTSSSGLAKARIFTFNPGAPTSASADPLTQLFVDIARASDALRPSLKDLHSILEEEFHDLKLMIPMKSVYKVVDAAHPHRNYLSLDNLLSSDDRSQLLMYTYIDHFRPLIFVQSNTVIRPLSLGQLSFLRFIMTAFSNAGPSSIFIIDEPENFLHPNLISRFMRTLNKVLDLTSSIAIIATHSPFVVREVQSAQVHVIRCIEEITTVSKPRMQTLGANVSSISNEVFGDDLPTHLYEELIKHAQANSQSFTDALEKYAGQLSTEALMTLRIIMERNA